MTPDEDIVNMDNLVVLDDEEAPTETLRILSSYGFVRVYGCDTHDTFYRRGHVILLYNEGNWKLWDEETYIDKGEHRAAGDDASSLNGRLARIGKE
jgi:hypothetical protein